MSRAWKQISILSPAERSAKAWRTSTPCRWSPPQQWCENPPGDYEAHKYKHKIQIKRWWFNQEEELERSQITSPRTNRAAEYRRASTQMWTPKIASSSSRATSILVVRQLREEILKGHFIIKPSICWRQRKSRAKVLRIMLNILKRLRA